MATELEQPSPPQFEVETLPGGLAFGTVVKFNGQRVENVASVSTSTTITTDDVTRATITIELVGEPVLVNHATP